MMPAKNTLQLSKVDLEELLHCKVESFTSCMLTAPGENYGSTMLQVDVTLLPDHRKIPIVAKLIPESLHMCNMFKISETMPKEIYMYLLARPEFYTIQEEYGIPRDLFLDVIPKCYGARTSRKGGIDALVDEGATILLENLKTSGYKLVDRIVGMDLKHTEYVLTCLARFHATAIVIKLKKPRVFKDTLLKAAAYVSCAPPPGEKSPLDTLDVLTDIPLIAQHKEKLKAVLRKGREMREMEDPPKPREPFATLIHDDFWINNMMFSYDGLNGENISGLQILDFQSITCGSAANDLLFFLFTSTDLSMTTEQCDRMIHLYHQRFTEWLELFGCNTKPFSYEKFLDEIKSEGVVVFEHVFYMLRVLCRFGKKAPDLTKTSEYDEIFTDNSGYSDVYYKKTERLLREFLSRNWI